MFGEVLARVRSQFRWVSVADPPSSFHATIKQETCFYLLYTVSSHRETSPGSTVWWPLQLLLAKNPILFYALEHHTPLSTESFFPPQGAWYFLQASTLPSTLLCYGNGACWTRESLQRAALCFVSAYTIDKTVMPYILSLSEKQLCTGCFVLCQAGQLRRQSLLIRGLPSGWTEMPTWFTLWRVRY